MLTMQEALLRLANYWADQGCLLTQPMNTEVGAGTLNPATFLRVLGPEPWRVAYVEPSVRPDDSRYGDNPNRLQTHTQFQVILKPEPGDAQERYLDSLRVLGIDISRHDVRFVEDNWAAPAVGAWGLGWEVWLDGLEITQFTYFQQAGGYPLDPVSVEITYGMERIMMALQGTSHVKDISYAPGISYGEVFGQAECEMSRYYLDEADISTNRALFEAYQKEARRMLDARLPVPAHGYVLKCSHAFNVLDSRQAIGATERARAFARMRGLAHEVAELWMARREEIGHPLGTAQALTPPTPVTTFPKIDTPATVAFEIGVEELPAGEVIRTAEAVQTTLAEKLAATRLEHGPIRVVASPRRIASLVEAVHPRETDYQQTIRGPRVSAAYDPEGNPTPAALGFARAQGVAAHELQRLTMDGGEYVGVVRQVPGRNAAEVLAAVLPEVVAELRAEKNMRWNAPGLSFARPIRWILALLGEHVIPLTVSTILSGRTTRTHRAAAEPVLSVPSADDYLPLLAQRGIVADGEERRRVIRMASTELATRVGGVIDFSGEKSLLTEIVNLVEQPAPILGHFDEKYLELPTEVLTTVMRKHQRYLPMRNAQGQLLPYFVAVANGDCDADLVRAGNEAVLRARYEDAAFFWGRDRQLPPETMKQGLASLTFEERLGSMADRAGRVTAIAHDLATHVTLNEAERATLTRAGELAKFDLASQMVIELSSLAGVMAREYARRAGEPEAVADALFEMELPRHADDALPVSAPGALLALADRFDLLVGLFALGSAPTGSSDPFGLRRAALGIVSMLRAQPRLIDITVTLGVAVAAAHQPVPCSEPTQHEAADFVLRRFSQQLTDAGHPIQLIRAVLPLAATPARAESTVAELASCVDDPEFRGVVMVMQRVARIVPPDTRAHYDPKLFTESAEHELHEAVRKVRSDLGESPAELASFITAASGLAKPIDTFFTDVLVMADDPAIKANRLGLLASVRDLGAHLLAWQTLD